MQFKEFNLDPRLNKAIETSGFKKPTRIQHEAIPAVLSGQDLMASAQTGTGKTAAFVLPVLQQLLSSPPSKGKGPRVLILTPTRELATQVNDNIHQFSKFIKLTNGTVVGGVAYPPQYRLLGKPLDILVATPGRLMDHMENGRVDFSRLETLVLDEADRMLDMGFLGAVKKIAAALPRDRQTLLFSATLEGPVLKVAKQLLSNPQRIALAANKERHKSIRQHLHHANDVSHKHDLLNHHINDAELTRAVIFTATKRSADRLSKKLNAQNHSSAPLHGNMSQNKRRRTVDDMRKGKVRLLVATDVAARGLDITGITHVINFDLPTVPEDYIHRIGRTGRAGERGSAISLVGPDDRGKLAGIERLTGQKIQHEIIEGLEPSVIQHKPRTDAPGKKKKKPAGGYSRGKSKANQDSPPWRKKPQKKHRQGKRSAQPLRKVA